MFPKVMPRRFLAVVALCLSVLTLSAADPVWLTDLDQGMKIAKAEKKSILVDFTGSDWCGWCIRLKKEVFDHAEPSGNSAALTRTCNGTEKVLALAVISSVPEYQPGAWSFGACTIVQTGKVLAVAGGLSSKASQ